MRSLAGTSWRLVQAQAFHEQGQELSPPLGPQPIGVLHFTEDRMIACVGDGQLDRRSDTRARPFAAYAGAYEFDGQILITHADSASSPEYLTDQKRRIRFDGDTSMVVIPINAVLGHGSGLALTWLRLS